VVDLLVVESGPGIGLWEVGGFDCEVLDDRVWLRGFWGEVPVGVAAHHVRRF
jgi:hypothetical protein